MLPGAGSLLAAYVGVPTCHRPLPNEFDAEIQGQSKISVRVRCHKLTSGVTARILRLIATAAEDAVRSRMQRLDARSFGDNLVPPLVAMIHSARRRDKILQQRVGA